MTSEEQLPPSIPAVVDVSVTEVEKLSKLDYGVGTPGTMATTPCTPSPLSPIGFTSPVSIFASFAASSSRTLFEDNGKKLNTSDSGTMITEATTTANEDNDTGSVGTSKSSKPLGISKPLYGIEDDDVSATEERIGIDPSDYDVPERDIPLSAFDFFAEKKQKPTDKMQDEVDEGDDDGDNLWQLRLLQSQNHPDIIDEEDEYHHEHDPDDNINRLLHKQTSEGRYLFNSRPVDAPCKQLKYSLEHGKSTMSTVQRQVSKRKSLKTRPNVATRSQSDPGIPPSEASHKVFLLLLAPQSKIFEIIQIFYAPHNSTIGDVLDLIPANATEPALASQSYTGLCRPKDGIHIEPDAMASAAGGPGTGCARILKGEILIAIPEGFSSRSCAKLSTPILANRKVGKLMDRSDPLSKIKKRKKKKRRPSSQRNSKGYKSITVEGSQHVDNSKGEEEPSIERLDNKERDLLEKVHVEPNDDSVPDLLMANSSFGQDSGKSPSSSEIGRLNDVNLKTIRNSSVEVWQTTMSLRSDSSSVSSIDFGTLNEGRRRTSETVNSLPVISAAPGDYSQDIEEISFEDVEHETRSRKEESHPTSTNRVRKASAIIIQSAARRVLSINRTRMQFPQSNHQNVIRSNSFSDDATRLHHVCAIIIQAHARALIAKNVIKNRGKTEEPTDQAEKKTPDLSELQTSLQTKDVNGAIAAFSKILAGIDANDEMKEQMMLQLHQSVAMKN